MQQATQFYIGGAWVNPLEEHYVEVINPATEQPVAIISLASVADVDRAIAAAKNAFPHYSQTSIEERLGWMQSLMKAYQRHYSELVEAITLEMGAPAALSKHAQAATGLGHLSTAIELLKSFRFEEEMGCTRICKEPVGVCGLITPWNWPMNQIMCKLAPALAMGCTVVLKPSQVAPLDAYILARMIDEAGFPPGVFNLINGAGPVVGERLASHADVDMVSLTGSTAAGAQLSKHAADSVKRVSLELGGKSANIILDDAELKRAVKFSVLACFANTGQSCNAPTRLLVPEHLHDQVVSMACAVADGLTVGPPDESSTTMGPQANKRQWQSVQALIQRAIDAGCELACGGVGLPAGLERGFYSKPTIFCNLKNSDIIAREEVFGPVLSIIPYRDEAEAVEIANDSVYGLSGYVQSGSLARARSVAKRLRTGMVHINGAATDLNAPFGGYKQSGNGREWGAHGFEEFLETKAIMGFDPEAG